MSFSPVTAADIKARKGKAPPLVCLTAYTAPVAKAVAPHVDMILVGDSLGMVLYGMENTQGVDLETMIRHGQAVRRGAPDAFIIIDMPFGTYENSPEEALTNGARLMEATGCNAVKLEGGRDMSAQIKLLTAHSIPVMGHIGLLPQSVTQANGYKVKGRSTEEEDSLLQDAKALEEAGAFALVLEAIVEPVAARITQSVSLPCIGIGASPACDGQVLVTEDITGLSGTKKARFVKLYKDLGADIHATSEAFSADVKAGRFPGTEHVYT